MTHPTPEEIKSARLAAGLTQTQAGALIRASRRTWQNWEAPVGSQRHRNMPVAKWRLFNLLIEKESEK